VVPPRLVKSPLAAPDFSIANLGENKANVNLLFSPLFRERLFRPAGGSCTFSSMATLTPAVRMAASSILLLSLIHIAFWAILAIELGGGLPNEFPYNVYAPAFWIISVAGVLGVVIAIAVLSGKAWARIAALVLGAIVMLFCAFGMLAPILLISGAPPLAALGLDVHLVSKSEFLRLFVVYLFVFLVAIWWIVLFSRKSTAVQFTSVPPAEISAIPGRPVCPPPIALLAWLMIASSTLSAVSWPLILGRVPAMLFTHVYSLSASKWIWIANILAFFLCGFGLLKLWRWSYTAAIGVHVFWLVSLFVSQISPAYPEYIRTCLNFFQIPQNYPGVDLLRFPQSISAVVSAIPTALLVAGMFYYRPNFLKAVESSKRVSK